MIRTLFNYSLGLLTVVFSLVQTCEDIPVFDYEIYPYQPFEFEHLDLSVTLEPDQALVRGVATYTVSSKIDGLTELRLHIQESAIDDVMIEEEEVDYRVSKDSLIILLPDSSITDEDFELSITWQSNSEFGLYLDSESNFWSSKNPLAHRHWFPVFDHPRNEVTFDASFVIPLETEVLFNGELVSSEINSATTKKIHFNSTIAVPVTGLGFALGDFVITEVASGLTSIRLFSSEKGFSEDERIELVRDASKLKKDVEKVLSMEYPWEGLNIVILPDNYWEEKTHGAGTIFLYENLGGLSAQLKRGIYAQWFGEYQRGELFFDFDRGGYELMRTALHFSFNEEPVFIDNPDTLNTISSWNNWQQSFQNKDELFQETVRNSLPEIVRSWKGIVDFNEYAELWYEETGIPWFDVMPEEFLQKSNDDGEVLNYHVDVFYDEIQSNLDLVFELQEGVGEELYSLDLVEYTFEDTISHEVNFTDKIDTVSIKLSPSVEYVSLKDGSISIQSIQIGEFPLFFLLSQLRSENPIERRAAAELLSFYSDNPDLQLALNDVMNQEQDASVKAALLGTMGRVTNGATGTEQQFLDGLNSEEEKTQLISLVSLKSYPGNEMVKSAVRNKILRTDSELVFEEALHTYLEVSEANEIISLAQRLQRADSTGSKSLKVMFSSSEIDSNEVYIPVAESYLDGSFPYQTRRTALQFLLAEDSDQERWINRFKSVLEDRDPRIRYSSLDAVNKLSPAEALKILKSIEIDEFDVRILLKADELLEELSE